MVDRIGQPFVILWEDGSVSAKDNAWVSSAYDMRDCDAMEGIKNILAADEDGDLVPVTLGPFRRLDTDEEWAFRYGAASLLAGTRIAGTVTYTDH